MNEDRSKWMQNVIKKAQSGEKVTVPGEREFEVRRIIRAKINPEFLQQFRDKLREQNGTAQNENGVNENE